MGHEQVDQSIHYRGLPPRRGEWKGAESLYEEPLAYTSTIVEKQRHAQEAQ